MINEPPRANIIHINFLSNIKMIVPNLTKVIFLDIDGVLTKQKDLLVKDKYGKMFNSKCVKNLKSIVDETEAKIVLTSDWKDSGLDVMVEMWNYRRLPGELIGITPKDTINNSRINEIQIYISDNCLVNYVIIDDLVFPDDIFINKKVVCNSMFGLTPKKAELAIKILNNYV